MAGPLVGQQAPVILEYRMSQTIPVLEQEVASEQRSIAPAGLVPTEPSRRASHHAGRAADPGTELTTVLQQQAIPRFSAGERSPNEHNAQPRRPLCMMRGSCHTTYQLHQPIVLLWLISKAEKLQQTFSTDHGRTHIARSRLQTDSQLSR